MKDDKSELPDKDREGRSYILMLLLAILCTPIVLSCLIHLLTK